jgi:hypothetical protein
MTLSPLSTKVTKCITGRFTVKSPEHKSAGIDAGRLFSRGPLLVGQLLTIGSNSPSINPHSTSCTQELNLVFI